MLKKSFSLLALVLLFTSVTAQAQAFKVGYTDHEFIIALMPEYKSIQLQLKNEYDSSQKVLQSMMEEYQGKVERYQKQQALLSEDTRKTREAELIKAQEDIQKKAAESERGLTDREAELLSPIFERVDTAIKAVSEEKGLDLVLRIQAGPLQPIILYANEKTVVDITPEVAERLGLKSSNTSQK